MAVNADGCNNIWRLRLAVDNDQTDVLAVNQCVAVARADHQQSKNVVLIACDGCG